jgi:hypothetical protein
VGASERAEDIRKGGKRVNIVETVPAHIYKWKNEAY